MRAFLFELVEGVRIAGQAIWANKLRSVLTTLGIVIGIASVTLMATVINGLNQELEDTLSQLGADVLYVSKWPWGNNVGLDWWNYVNRPELRADLVEPIRTKSDLARRVAPMTSTNRTVQYRENSMRANVTGSTPDFGRIRNVEIEQGRFFTESEERSARNVCVLGATVADQLFPIRSPLGQDVRLGTGTCRVVGVQKKEGSGLFGSETSGDERVLIPFSTFEKLFGMSRWRGVTIMVQVGDTDAIPRARDELTGVLRLARNVEPGTPNNFEINDQEQVRSTFSGVKVTIYAVGLSLTALALIVGGIGVMNIMFVSVRERTKEIGLRKAVGAKRRTILLQFLIEAVIVCLIGGSIGVGLSALLTVAANSAGITAVLPVSTVVLAFVICVGVGISFGVAPAWQAAKAEPIEALRYE